MRWTSPDPIIPGIGEGGNPNAVGCLGASTYSPLTVDYHENQLLEQLNLENSAWLHDPTFRLPLVPTNTIAFDRYAYSLNNPLRYTDPTGHCPFCAILAFIPGWGWVALGAVAVAGVVYYAAGGPEAVTNGLYQAGQATADGINALFARGDGGAASSAQHLAMLLGVSVAGFAPHPGMPDPEGRDRKHNAEGLRNTLRSIQRNMKSGENLNQYLTRQGWSAKQIEDYTFQIRNYLDNVLPFEKNFDPKMVNELLKLAGDLGVQ
jgi:hypothetical protein